MPELKPFLPENAAWYNHADMVALRIRRHERAVRHYLHAGDVTRASYYADRVLVLVGKAITEEPMS
jgi:hypothetical protein